MKYVFTLKKKDLKFKKEIAFESNFPLRQDKDNWYVVDKDNIRHTIKKVAYEIRIQS